MNTCYEIKFTRNDGSEMQTGFTGLSSRAAWGFAFYYASEYLENFKNITKIEVRTITLKQDKN